VGHSRKLHQRIPGSTLVECEDDDGVLTGLGVTKPALEGRIVATLAGHAKPT